MKRIISGCYLLAVLLLAGCSNVDWLNKDPISSMPLVVPLQPEFEQEFALVQLDQLLTGDKLNRQDRVELLFQRGQIYDSLGLRVLAHRDFTSALSLEPKSPLIYSYLGNYFTLVSSFDAAYEAFDSVIELDPTYSYARFNLGTALYYGGRYPLAQDDLQAFYQSDINNPYTSLWLYLVEINIDETKAKSALRSRYQAADKAQWGWRIVEFYLGDISQKKLLASVMLDTQDKKTLAEHLSETYFYLGKYYLSLGDKNSASALFKLTVANNVNYFIEHRFALLELALLG